MSDDKSITRTSGAIEVRTMDDVERIARTAVASGLVRVKRAEEAAVILLTGRELGLSPMQSLRGIYVVNGAPVLSADLLVAVVRASGLCASWRTIESTADLCTIETLRKGEEHPARRTWTMVDAKRAGITGKQTWAQYPAAMLRHRCAADLAREVYPDVCLGLYTPEELGADEQRPAATDPSPQRIPDLASVGIEARSPLPTKVVDVGAEVSDAQLPPAVEAFYEQVGEIGIPGEGVAVWLKHRHDLAPLNPAEREAAWKALVAKVEEVGKMKNASVWLRKAVKEEDARRGQPEEPPPDGTSGPRRGPGPVASAEGSASVSGGAGGAPAATVTALVPEWATTYEGMRLHLADKTARRAVEHSVRLHGRRLGEWYRRLAAERLVSIDTPSDDGTRLTIVGATQQVERWAHEGPIARKAGVR